MIKIKSEKVYYFYYSCPCGKRDLISFHASKLDKYNSEKRICSKCGKIMNLYQRKELNG